MCSVISKMLFFILDLLSINGEVASSPCDKDEC